MQEELLVLGLQKQEQHTLEEVMKQYGKLVYYVIHKIIDSEHHDAIEEIFSDTFFDLWNNANSIDLSKGTLKNLLCVIARNNAINYLKKSKHNTLIYLDECKDLHLSKEDLEESIITNENIQNILDAIKELNELDSSIFILRYFYHWSIEDIMKKYDLKRHQIDNRLSKGRKKLKNILLLNESR